MAQTVAEIKAGYEADPGYTTLTRNVNGEDALLSTAERDAKLTTWAANERQRQLNAETEEARKTLRRQVRLARTTLIAIRDDATITQAEAVAYIRQLATIQLGVIDALIDLRLIEPEEG